MAYEEEESIYNLIPKVTEKPPKPAMHVSKFSSPAKKELNANKNASKTMGPAKVPLNDPSRFMRKHEKEPKLPDKTAFSYSDSDRRKVPVPSHAEKPVMGLKSNKNFITTNAVENIMSIPKKAAVNYADTRNGSTHALDPSGLAPKYVRKKDYGKTPSYLTKRKEEVEQAQREYDEYVKESFRRGAMESLSDEERHSIIQGLKKNWEEIHHLYQGLSVVTDTAPKKNRKERMEAEMNQLERDIELLEKHNHIYIANRDDRFSFC
eukprot:gene3882-4426_t